MKWKLSIWKTTNTRSLGSRTLEDHLVLGH